MDANRQWSTCRVACYYLVGQVSSGGALICCEEVLFASYCTRYCILYSHQDNPSLHAAGGILAVQSLINLTVPEHGPLYDVG
jgi:hypothetical protein